jgi:hypothetical protein
VGPDRGRLRVEIVPVPAAEITTSAGAAIPLPPGAHFGFGVGESVTQSNGA